MADKVTPIRKSILGIQVEAGAVEVGVLHITLDGNLSVSFCPHFIKALELDSIEILAASIRDHLLREKGILQ